MQILRRIIVIALFLGLLISGWRFAANNAAPINLNFIFGDVSDVPLWAIVVVSFLSGAFFVGMISLYKIAKVSLIANRHRKEAKRLTDEIHELRSIPLSNTPSTQSPSSVDDHAAPSSPTENLR